MPDRETREQVCQQPGDRDCYVDQCTYCSRWCHAHYVYDFEYGWQADPYPECDRGKCPVRDKEHVHA